MKKIILSLFTCFTVLFVQAQAKPPVQVQATQQQTDKNPLGLVQDEDVAIYPNPSNGVFTISVSNLDAQQVELTILNVIGNEIYRETLKRDDAKLSKTINLDRHAKGLYYVKLEADNYSAVRRVVIK
ncbi:T9SS type A sorting domain-containing protein [Pontibacter anaerobius]|uniref:T9SS type A sorting domain-containing protein n=1 Tax=Pontibacter anaerobius TaxID=2993940 RepID=A0ABT3RJ72_9BACT|nr:T9SS type A sorting domain-containing protein [Pontibacter anaerobius]MCX2741250.1 T9SS type A sorting domain-containing protein [Pontibacter anaerobius]